MGCCLGRSCAFSLPASEKVSSMIMAGKARRRPLTPALIALTLATTTSPASARQWSAVCSNLSGVRVDDPGAEPTFTQDMLKGASWAYSWNTDTRRNSDPSSLPCLRPPTTNAGPIRTGPRSDGPRDLGLAAGPSASALSLRSKLHPEALAHHGD